jgi:hypothetical protein
LADSLILGALEHLVYSHRRQERKKAELVVGDWLLVVDDWF